MDGLLEGGISDMLPMPVAAKSYFVEVALGLVFVDPAPLVPGCAGPHWVSGAAVELTCVGLGTSANSMRQTLA